MTMKDIVSTSAFHLETCYLFVRADIKGILFPVVSGLLSYLVRATYKPAAVNLCVHRRSFILSVKRHLEHAMGSHPHHPP